MTIYACLFYNNWATCTLESNKFMEKLVLINKSYQRCYKILAPKVPDIASSTRIMEWIKRKHLCLPIDLTNRVA